MVNRIYTQDDYDKITRLYDTYQKTKDRYTPEKQKEIESAFGLARIDVSNKIKESKNSIADMYLDDNGNTVQVYGDGRSEIVQYAPVKNTNTQNPINVSKAKPKQNQNQNVKGVISDKNNQNNDLIYMGNDDAGNPIYIKRQNASSYLGWDFDKYGLIGPEPSSEQQNKTNNNSSSNNYYSKYMQMKGTGAPSNLFADWFKFNLGDANSSNASKVRSELKSQGLTNQQINDFIADRSRGTLQYNEQIKPNGKNKIQSVGNDGTYSKKGLERLSTYSEDFRKQVQKILNTGGYIDDEGYLHRKDGSVITKI